MIWLSLSAANDQTMNTTNPVSHSGLFYPLASSTNTTCCSCFSFFFSSLNLHCSPSPGQLQDADGAQPVHQHLQLLLDAVRRHLPPHAHHCGRLCGGAAALLVLRAGMGWGLLKTCWYHSCLAVHLHTTLSSGNKRGDLKDVNSNWQKSRLMQHFLMPIKRFPQTQESVTTSWIQHVSLGLMMWKHLQFLWTITSWKLSSFPFYWRSENINFPS